MPQGYHKVVEVYPDVPRTFTRRQGDWSQEGGNNTLIVMGTDRAKNGPATIHDGLGSVEAPGAGTKAGSILAVVGRKDPDGNPDHKLDDAFLYLTMKSSVDQNLGTTFETNDTGPAAVAKADHIRIIFRKNLKVSATEKETHAFVNDDHLHVDMQGKARLSLDVDGGDSTATIDIQDNTIVVKSDGSVTITSKSKVTVNTHTATVNASESTTVNTPTLKITGPGDTTIDGRLTVQGATSLQATLDVTGMSTLAGNTSTPTLTSGGTTVSAAGMATSGNVSASAVSIGGNDYSAHKHQEHGKGGGITGPPMP